MVIIMADNKKMVEDITSRDVDFAQWYTDIVKKADLADYTDTKGCIAIKPYGYAIWENIQKYTDELFKKAGVKNVYLPVLIPEGLLQKEKDLNQVALDQAKAEKTSNAQKHDEV